MDYPPEALGQVIRRRREARGLSQAQLGATAGYQRGAGVSVSRVENGLTRPGEDRLRGLARALGVDLQDLEVEATELTVRRVHEEGAGAATSSRERLNARGRQVQAVIDARMATVERLGEAFDTAHDRARDQLVLPFVDTVDSLLDLVQEAPPPPGPTGGVVAGMTELGEAAGLLQLTQFGVTQALAMGLGGATVGRVAGAAASYATFTAAAALGTASTGTPIAGLSGAAASSATLALLGRGTLVAGGAGVAGGTMLLAAMVAGPTILLAAGGVVWAVNRNRKQQLELRRRLDEAEQWLDGSRPGFEALVDLLPRMTSTLDYVGLHGGHALERWRARLGPARRPWQALSVEDQSAYQDFVKVIAAQLAVVAIDVRAVIEARGDERERLIALSDEILSHAQRAVETLV